MNVWPPYLAAGVRVRHISDDFRRVDVALRLGLFNRNYVNVHFGGSLFAMTDPFYMLMYMKNLGPDYVVWDKAASIDFVLPGRGTVTAEFQLNEDDFSRAREQASEQKSVLLLHPVEILNAERRLVARVERTIYVRRKSESKAG
ncbi:MAG: DUF4442 domain-containing protein [Wenzhouxiangella sp.]|jgi:acyl-coenzyme A thioesterase PaaI-like protein|nr:DUF4442 domain-containing protein [Wenzhouxiangella sp.]